MQNWFQCKVKYLASTEEGLIKRISETYLVDAMSFTEAEARILEEVSASNREITLVSVARSNITEVVFYGDTEFWFKVKMTYVVADEESGKEKKVTTYLLVNASDLSEAYIRINEHLKEMIVPYEIPKIEKSPIVDVVEYHSDTDGLKKVEEGIDPEAEAEPEELED